MCNSIVAFLYIKKERQLLLLYNRKIILSFKLKVDFLIKKVTTIAHTILEIPNATCMVAVLNII